ncbi:MAG: prealbumin-like fold domain-containing protein [Oscillospiraceae bacterium]|nr:prealbumin-like fold domain-containing protein [Oscillospiraceae bacterium]
MFNLLCGLFSGGGSQCAANVCFQAIDPNDCPICGAVYQLTCACGKFINAITGRNGCVTFCGVCPGTYTLTQEIAPYGYVKDGASHAVNVSNRCFVRIDGLPMRCFQSINQKSNTLPAQSPAPIIGPTVPVTIDTLEGEGTAGCKIKVEFPGGCCCRTCVRRNGTWSMDVPASETLLPGEKILVTQCCPCMLPSDPVEVTVVDT